MKEIDIVNEALERIERDYKLSGTRQAEEMQKINQFYLRCVSERVSQSLIGHFLGVDK